MLRLIMQYEDASVPSRYNGSASTVSAGGLNLNFRVFEVDCPELEEILKSSQVEGSNSRKLVLMGVEIFDKPKPPVEPPKPAVLIEAQTQPTLTTEERVTSLKERLLAKQAERNAPWYKRLLKGSSKPKPLPLPG